MIAVELTIKDGDELLCKIDCVADCDWSALEIGSPLLEVATAGARDWMDERVDEEIAA